MAEPFRTTVYHYAKPADWQDIKSGSYQSKYSPGLGGGRRVGQVYPEAWETAGTFGLIEPKPKDWTDNPYFKDIWAHLRQQIGALLLEIDVDQDTNAFVIDRGYIEGFLYRERKDVTIPERYRFGDRKEAERAYIESKVPLQEYLRDPQKFKYSLPEVVFIGVVPLEKIRISHEQPIMDDLWNEYGKPEYTKEARRHFLKRFKDLPELDFWREAHKSEIAELGGEFNEHLRFR